MTARSARRDEGSVLPLVLVMMVVSALIVVPMLAYIVSVLRANTVVADATRSREAAEAGLRVALLDPAALFVLCDGSSTPVDGPGFAIIDDRNISTSCAQVEEVGPLNVLGYQTPIGSTATQLGAGAPDTFVGTRTTGPVVPPYPADAGWWSANTTSGATSGRIWMPDLPTKPGTVRSSTPFAMPASFDCVVYLPGYYPDPITVSAGNVYFASGVYYFEDEVRFGGNANVVVGYGTEGLPTDCADDVQVGANLIAGPSTFDINGGGATFVFGADGHLVIDNSAATTGLSVRFNQRYAEIDQGGRVSIMSVNGDDLTPTDHVVDDVVDVPRSMVAIDDLVVTLGSAGAEYTPSGPRFTSKARTPVVPGGLTAVPLRTGDPAPNDGAVLLTWDEVGDQGAGGALIDEYSVSWLPMPAGSATPTPVCEPEQIVSPAPARLACVVTGLRTNRGYSFSVTATNSAGFTSPAASASATPVAGSDLIGVPGAPTGITVTPYADAAGVAWAAPVADGGAPITSYGVTAQRVFLVPSPPPTDGSDPLPPTEQYEDVSGCTTTVAAWQAAPTTCVVPNLVDLPSVDALGNANVGYRFVVTATNATGTSIEAVHVPAPAVLAFDGPAVPPPAVAVERIVVPWIPEPIIDVSLTGAAPTTVSIPGYVSTPMGRLTVDNPNRQSVRINGGLLASTFDIRDPRASGPESLPIGYQSDIVLQRKIRLVSKVNRTTATATVQVNEDGRFAINSWMVQ